jgi:hypothetical protein
MTIDDDDDVDDDTCNNEWMGNKGKVRTVSLIVSYKELVAIART